MSPSKGYYSIVQYCPDLARREAVNIGVVLLVPDRSFLESRLVAGNERAKRVFGIKGTEAKMISEFKRSFSERIVTEQGRIGSLESFQKFIETRGNNILLTPPAFIKVRECQATIDQLFEELVGGKTKTPKPTALTKSLQARFDEEGLEPIIHRDVRLPVPILDRETKIPFGYQNGVFHLLQPVAFEAEKEEINFNRALRFSMEGKIFHEHRDDVYGDLQFNVIGRFASRDDRSIPIVKKVLAESNVRLHLEDDLSELVDEIRRTGRPRATTM